jgi:hypothetical protein
MSFRVDAAPYIQPQIPLSKGLHETIRARGGVNNDAFTKVLNKD